MGEFPARFGSLVLREGGPGLLPEATGQARQASRIPALPLRLFDPATGGLRLTPGPFHAIPDLTQGASRLISRVEDIQPALQRSPSIGSSLSLHCGDPG